VADNWQYTTESLLAKIHKPVPHRYFPPQTSIQRLKEIALKSHPFSAPEYIDLIIETEKVEGKGSSH
jgi:hypothetical protein